MRNALTVDLEDWYHPELVRHRLSAEEREVQIEESTRLLLGLLGEKGVKATFFVLGEIVQRCPRLIESIVAQGHELACHGMRHRPLWDMTPDKFRAELQQFATTTEDVVPGVKAVGFRAPTFSLDNRTVWALEILNDLGYRYDSSVFPFKTPVYGVDNCPLAPYRPSWEDVTLEDPSSMLVEFPLSVWSWLGFKVPVCGGFYLRTVPFRFVRFCLRQITQRQPFTIYVHPWEAYQGTPRLPLPLVSRFITYHNIGTTMRRLEALLEEFSFAPMRMVLEEMGELGR